MRTCDNCGYDDVSEDYHRVFSNNEGELEGCIMCSINGSVEGEV